MTLRVDPLDTPDDLLQLAVRTACADGKPHFVNHPMNVADLGAGYGVLGRDTCLPQAGGCYTLVSLNVAASVRRHPGGCASYLSETLVQDVALTAELMAARIRFLVEESDFFEHDWLAREGWIQRERFTGVLGVFGLAEAVDELMARDHAWGVDGGTARYGQDRRANALAQQMIETVSQLVEEIGMPYCEVTGGHALLHAQSVIEACARVTGGARVPFDRDAGLYRHIRTVAPHHQYFGAGISDPVRFESTVADNPAAVVAVMRGAFALGMRDFRFEVVGTDTHTTGGLSQMRDLVTTGSSGLPGAPGSASPLTARSGPRADGGR
jgi:YjjI family glycine radical enzyme